MVARQRRAWCPQRLRERRERQRLTLEQAAEELRRLARDQDGVEPGATAQTVWRHERGQYPGKLYRRLYCRLYQATEVELGFRPPLPSERAVSPATGPTTDMGEPAPPSGAVAAATVAVQGWGGEEESVERRVSL